MFTGYSKDSILFGEAELMSYEKAIMAFYDGQTFFMAISDNDVYVATVDWNNGTEKYELYSTMLSSLSV